MDFSAIIRMVEGAAKPKYGAGGRPAPPRDVLRDFWRIVIYDSDWDVRLCGAQGGFGRSRLLDTVNLINDFIGIFGGCKDRIGPQRYR